MRDPTDLEGFHRDYQAIYSVYKDYIRVLQVIGGLNIP